MDAMYAAIKKRQGKGILDGDHSATHAAQHTDVGGGTDLHGLVASLSDHEKHSLKQILNDSGNAMAIQKGEPSKEEQGKIAERANQENAENSLIDQQHEDDDSLPQDQSDDIAKSMLDHKNQHGPSADKPRNLGDRMKQYVAQKLKQKGKI